jgi:hypothetical protein
MQDSVPVRGQLANGVDAGGVPLPWWGSGFTALENCQYCQRKILRARSFSVEEKKAKWALVTAENVASNQAVLK